MSRLWTALLAGVLLAGPAAASGTLRIGMQDDPELLDPARSGGLPDRVVLAALCDKLIDTAPDGAFVPQLATAWTWAPDGLALILTLRPGVRFHDGTPMDAAAVRDNLERYRANPRSLRRGELKPVAAVEVVDPGTVRLRLSEPYAPLIAVLADRAGMMLSPAQIGPLGDGVAAGLVCAGPFRFNERVAQDRIVLDRFPEYWAGPPDLDRVIYRPFPDSTVRLASLRAGALDLIERVAPSDLETVRGERRLRLLSSPSIAFRTMSINLAGGTPLGHDPRVRAAFEAAIDRDVINQVAAEGAFRTANQFEPTGTQYWNPDFPVPARDPARARALLAQAGLGRVPVVLTVANNPLDQQTGALIQSMAGEAGFDVTLRTMEAVSATDATRRGDYEASILIWSGRADPDGNAAVWLACDGFLNWGKYCDPRMDELLRQGRQLTDPAARVPVYREIAAIMQRDRPHIVLYNPTWLWAASDRVEGFVPQPDGLIRLGGVRLRP